eukprot:m.86327 g.86327  ORF g.86327 m.86327 type:complete len:57 (-) comp8756_c1_seq1:243-413(-)
MLRNHSYFWKQLPRDPSYQYYFFGCGDFEHYVKWNSLMTKYESGIADVVLVAVLKA